MIRFLVIAHPRSGTQLLCDSIDQHPAARCYGELFHDDPERATWFRLDSGRYLRPDEEPSGFLAELYSGGGDAVGFKLFYGDLQRAWPGLTALGPLRVIHLWRDNLLESLVSEKIGERTGEWEVRREHGRAPTGAEPFALPPEEAQRFFEFTERWRGRALALLGDAPRIDLEYRRLDREFDAAMAEVFAHLELPPHIVEKRLIRQSRRSVREQLLNFDELRSHFSGGPWARHFAD